MVRLGQRVEARASHAATEQWRNRLLLTWYNLENDITLIALHRKRAERIAAKLNDPALLNDYPDGSAERTEAINARDRYLASIEARETRVSELTWGFPEFWANRPPGTEEWLRTEFFRSPDDAPDPVIAHMQAKAPAWAEIAEIWEQRTIAGDPCPF